MSFETEVVEVSALEAQTRAEVDIQVATAKRYPRDVAKCLDRSTKLATRTLETAESCHYSIKRGGENIEGPSVRLAEIIATNWQNLRVQARVMEIGAREVVCQGICLDLETNVAISKEVRRRLVDKNGRRYSDDLFNTTANAGCSIALRNAVLAAVPEGVWGPVYAAVLKCIHGGEVPIAQRRANAVKWFSSRGVSEENLLRALGLGKIGELVEEHLATLTGWRNAITEKQMELSELCEGVGPAPAPQNPPAPAAAGPAEPSGTGVVPPPPQEEKAKRGRGRTAPKEVTEGSPPAAAQPAGSDPKAAANAERDVKFKEWLRLAVQLTPEEKEQCRAAAEAAVLHPLLDLDQVHALLAKGVELLEARR